jgi:hypothetical protein
MSGAFDPWAALARIKRGRLGGLGADEVPAAAGEARFPDGLGGLSGLGARHPAESNSDPAPVTEGGPEPPGEHDAAEREAMAAYYGGALNGRPYRPTDPDPYRDGLLTASRMRPPAWADPTPPPPRGRMVRVLRAEQPEGWWPVVAAASPSDGWNGASTWLEMHDVPSAAGWLRGLGGADVPPHQRGSLPAGRIMRAAKARHWPSVRGWQPGCQAVVRRLPGGRLALACSAREMTRGSTAGRWCADCVPSREPRRSRLRSSGRIDRHHARRAAEGASRSARRCYLCVT